MRVALRWAYLLAAGVFLGSIVCFSFVVAPAAFGAFGPAQAGDVVGAVLGPYYRLGRGAALLATAGAVLLGRGATARGRWWAAAGAHVVGLVAMAWAGSVVLPATQRLRAALHAEGAVPASSDEFGRLHRRAVALNGAALVAGIAGLGCAATALRE